MRSGTRLDRSEAAVFDLDGTLADTMPCHGRAWVAFSRRHGVEQPEERFLREWAGWKNAEILPLLFGRPISDAESAALADEKERAYREAIKDELVPMPGLLALLERLAQRDVPMAVATAAPPENRDFVLDRLDLRRFFRAIVSSEDAPRGKPFPDLFLVAAERVGANPTRCVAFEDAVNGVRAAVAAGMRTCAVLTTATPEALRAAGAEWTIPDFTELPESLERALFGG